MMKSKKNSSIYLIGLLLIVALMASLALVVRNQETRKGATFAGADILVLGHETRLEKEVGNEFSVQLYIDAKDAARVGAARTVFCFGPELSLANAGDVSDNVTSLTPNIFDGEIVLLRSYVEGDVCLNITYTTNQVNENLPSGMIEWLQVDLKAVATGSGIISIKDDLSEIVGPNPDSGNYDLAIEIQNVFNRSYLISDGLEPPPTATLTSTMSPVPTETVTDNTAKLNLKMAFTGLTNKEALCAQNWPVDIIVLGGGQTAVYSGVVLTATEAKTAKGEVVFETSIPLTRGYSNLSNAVFVKGPQHLQTKYGKDGQTDFYNRAGGEILLGMDKNDNVYDFSKYPILAGDVSGATEGMPDGRVDGRDFHYIKSKISVVRTAPTVVPIFKADFDGDCRVGNVDLSIMMRSLEEKLGQLY
jgi:hypothetical protein